MQDLATCAAHRAERVAETLMPHLLADVPLTRDMLNTAMRSAFDGTDADGRWSQRDSFELLEFAVVRHLRMIGGSFAEPRHLKTLIALAERLPTQTVRSEAQIDLQQFSTPLDLAGLATLLARPHPDDRVLEPSAGHGVLAAMLPVVASLHLNEIDAQRRLRLAALFPDATVTGVDAATIEAALSADWRPTLILMNPPFARSFGRGQDDVAAVRYFRASVRQLAPGGRVVAIMPDAFAPTGNPNGLFEASIEGCALRTALRLRGAFRKHGTSVAVRLYVVDKGQGSYDAETHDCERVADLVDALNLPDRMFASPLAASELVKRNSAVSLFRAVRNRPLPPPRAYHAPVRNEVLPVEYERLVDPAPVGEPAGVYLAYRASRIAFATAGEHPTPLVESTAMGSIPAPIPQHTPRLPERVVSAGLLSAAQLETVVYAGHAWSQFLPGRFQPDREGVGLKLAESGALYRTGYFLGDGTGAGKGRQIAACILDNWLAGRRRAVWISKNAALLDDARRDWSALGGLATDVQPMSAWRIDEAVGLDQGVLFVTYPTLRSMRGDHSRLRQLIDWAGQGFDGVLAFDEAHEMGGVAGGEGALGGRKGSQQGVNGVLLQNHLPGARVLYASATGASDINNLAYAVRLGLWGPETAFADREQFIAQIRAGGIAAMELVSRDLKATGLYAARALSFAGVEYEVLRHELTPEQVALYDIYADAWAVIHANMEDALKATAIVDAVDGETMNSGAKAAARSRFESTKQRFFGQLLLSMKLPTVLRAVEAHLAAGQSAVLQLVTTAESILDRRLDELDADARAELEIDLSPREYVVDYLARAFPTRQMRVYTDDTGKARSEPMVDAAGRAVYNPDAERARDALIERICALPPIMAALDALLEHFGHARVAEVTGRTRRLVTKADGRQKLEARSTRTGQAEAASFMAGERRILVFSDAGGTGRSYHASLDVANREQRVHFLLEPGWRADRAIQGLGRTHRTHQASKPLFRPVTTACKGELRFTSTIARRLDSLGALTRGQRQTGGQNLFDPADNLESDYAKAALNSWFHLLARGKLTSITLTEFEARTGLKLCEDDGVLKDELPPIQRWLNRLLALQIGLQNTIFDEFLALVETRVAAAREAGTLDIGVETILVERAAVVEDRLLRTDRASGATSHLLTLEIERRRHPVGLERIRRIAASDPEAVTLVNTRSGKVALRTRARAAMDGDGAPVPRIELLRPTRREYLREADLLESAWEEVDGSVFEARWEKEAQAEALVVDRDRVRLATGLLLPIWSALPSDHLVVNRIVDGEGQSWLGRLVFEKDVGPLLEQLGLDTAGALAPADVVAAVRQGGQIELKTPFAMTVRTARVNGQQRVEIVGAPPSQLAWLKSLGCFTEVIQYRTRVFVPVERATVVLDMIIGSVSLDNPQSA